MSYDRVSIVDGDRARVRSAAQRTLQQRVQKSARLLDSELPGWHKIINTDTLAMGSVVYCICGQLDDASPKFSALQLDDFNIGRGFYYPGNSNRLRPLWIYQIKKRLRADEQKKVDAMYRT